FVASTARCVDGDENALTPVCLQIAKESCPLLLVHGPWLRLYRGKAAAQHEGRSPLRVGGGEHQRHRSAFRPAMDRCTAGVGRVHHGTDIADALFKGMLGDTVGKPLATLVEDDYASEGCEPFQQVLVGGEVPVEVGVGKRSGDENEIARAVAKDSVGNVSIATPRVFDVTSHGRCSS